METQENLSLHWYFFVEVRLQRVKLPTHAVLLLVQAILSLRVPYDSAVLPVSTLQHRGRATHPAFDGVSAGSTGTAQSEDFPVILHSSISSTIFHQAVPLAL